MFRNCLAATLRNLARNKLYAAIKILGLAVGFAAAILIALFVRDEFSYDKWIPGYDRVVMLSEHILIPGQPPVDADVTWANIAGWLKLDYDGIQSIGRMAVTGLAIRRGDIEDNEWPAVWADPDIFKVLPLNAVAGNLATALGAPDGVVLTRSMARKYFGRDDPIGETLEVNRKNQMRVNAVIEDLPSNTHQNAKIFLSGLASSSELTRLDQIALTAEHLAPENSTTYIRLKPGATLESLRQALRHVLDKYVSFEIQGIRVASVWNIEPIPLADLHLRPGHTDTMKPSGDIGVIVAVSAVGVLIVLVAAINFVNLMTARATRRAIEVGVRKAAGATRRDLILQFFAESILYALLGMVFAVALVELILPSFNAFMDRTVQFPYWHDPVLAAGIIGLALAIGLLAGAYPALVLSAFRPANVLKGTVSANPTVRGLRQGLVVLQFAVLIGLVIATATVYRQTMFALHERLHFTQDQTVIIWGACMGAFKDEVKSLAGVVDAACSDGASINAGDSSTLAYLADGSQVLVKTRSVAAGFFEVYGLQPLAGRTLSKEHGADVVEYPDDAPSNPPIVINETAARQFGFAPVGAAVGSQVQWVRNSAKTNKILGKLPSDIIGVVPDFSLASARTAISPTVYYYEPENFWVLNVKLRGDAVPEVLKAMRAMWNKMDTDTPLWYQFVDQRVQGAYADVIRQGTAFAIFAGVAVFVAVLGLFGLSVYTAEQRTKEIGIRKAMGASSGDIVSLLLWQFAKPVLWANLIAWPIAGFVMNRWLHGFAYHVDIDLWTFAAAGGLALVIAIVTVVGHSTVVARAKPVSALRYE